MNRAKRGRPRDGGEGECGVTRVRKGGKVGSVRVGFRVGFGVGEVGWVGRGDVGIVSGTGF